MCQFHQALILRRYLTKKPKLQAARDLLEVANLRKQADKESFIGALELWHIKWQTLLDEHSTNPINGKPFYIKGYAVQNVA
jgi:hypothetical protein